MGMFVVHGAQAGGFSPISIYGTITNSVMEDSGLPSSEITIFLASLVVNLILAGDPVRRARRPQADVAADRPRRARTPLDEDLHRGGADASRPAAPARRRTTGTQAARRPPRPDPHPGRVRRRRRSSRWSSTRTSASSRSPPPSSWRCSSPSEHKDAVKQIAWPTVLLVAGVSTYATILTTAGSPEFVGNWAAGLGAAAIGALILCYVGGVVSAFASSTALLPVIIPIAVPLDRRRRHQRRPVRGRPRGLARRSSTSARSPPTAR